VVSEVKGDLFVCESWSSEEGKKAVEDAAGKLTAFLKSENNGLVCLSYDTDSKRLLPNNDWSGERLKQRVDSKQGYTTKFLYCSTFPLDFDI
jgi:hypothetical protein